MGQEQSSSNNSSHFSKNLIFSKNNSCYSNSCSYCNNTGYTEEVVQEPCSNCAGTGREMREGIWPGASPGCSSCNGRGYNTIIGRKVRCSCQN